MIQKNIFRTFFLTLKRAPLSASTLLLFISLLIYGRVSIMVKLAEWQSHFYSALEKKDEPLFKAQLKLFLVLVSIYIVFSWAARFFKETLSLSLRQTLTLSAIHRVYHGTVLSQLKLQTQVDHPDQRISEDIHLFFDRAVTLYKNALGNTITLFSFLIMLYQFKPSWVAIAFGYSALGTLLNFWIGRNLTQLQAEQQKREASFRKKMILFQEQELHPHAGVESLPELFEKLAFNLKKIIRKLSSLTAFSSIYDQIAYVLPFLVAAPLFFKGEIHLGELMQIGTAFASVQGSLSFLIQFYPEVTELKASHGRLFTLERAISTISVSQS